MTDQDQPPFWPPPPGWKSRQGLETVNPETDHHPDAPPQVKDEDHDGAEQPPYWPPPLGSGHGGEAAGEDGRSRREAAAIVPAASLLAEGPALALKRAAGQLEEAINRRREDVNDARKQLQRAHDLYTRRVGELTKALEKTSESRKLAGGFLGPVKLFDDRIVANGRTWPLTPELTATVDTAGNLSRTRRHTLTRFALLGPLSLFAPKGTKHDDRELFLLLEAPDWAEIVKCDKNAQSQTRSLAQAINLAARNVHEALRDREQRIAHAENNLEAAVKSKARSLRGRKLSEPPTIAVARSVRQPPSFERYSRPIRTRTTAKLKKQQPSLRRRRPR
jgi:hypothetical protein